MRLDLGSSGYGAHVPVFPETAISHTHGRGPCFRHASFFKTRGRAPKGVPGRTREQPEKTRWFVVVRGNNRKKPGGSWSYEGTTENPRGPRPRPRATKVATGCRHDQNRSPSRGSFLDFAKARSHGRNLGVRCRIPEALGVRHQKYLSAGGVARPCEHDLVREGHREPSAVLRDRTLTWVG